MESCVLASKKPDDQFDSFLIGHIRGTLLANFSMLLWLGDDACHGGRGDDACARL
jgi:hypothetical protein